MKFILLVFLFMSLANPIAGGKLFPGFNNPEKWMKRVIRKLQRKSSAYGQMIATNTAGISNNAGFISSLAACGMDYINNPDYGLSCCFEDTNNLGTCLCNGTTIDDTANPGSCCSANLKHPDHCLCSGTDMDNPNDPGNCCFKDSANPEQCLCNAANYTDNPNKRCFNLDWKGDGVCDDENNHGGCDFDGGDCCGEEVDTDLCTLCQCLEEEAPLPNAVACCFEDANNPGQCLCTGTDIDDPDNAGSCCVEDPDTPGTCCVDSITCNDQGTCSSGNSICECDSGFTGDRCNITTCPGSGGVVCSGNGNCNQGPPLACDCQAGFHGDDCAAYCVAATTCSGQGTCGVDGLCQCDAGLTGADCTEVWSSSNYILLINGGGGSGREVADVADIINPTRDCQSSTIATFPCLSPCNEADWQPQGGWVDGVLIICTAKNTNKCYALSQDGTAWNELTDTLAHQRWFGAGVVIKGTNPDDADRLWIMGGFFGDSQKTSEFVFSNGTIVPGPYPYGTTNNRGICMVQLDTGDVLILGGISTLKKVTRYNPTTGAFTTQQDMSFDKKEFACTVFYSDKHGGRQVVYAAGGERSGNTVQLLDYTQTETWETIENLPSSTQYGPRALTTQDGTGVYHFYTDHFTKLTCDSSSCSFSSWIDLDNQQVSRSSWMNILYIPDHLAVCT